MNMKNEDRKMTKTMQKGIDIAVSYGAVLCKCCGCLPYADSNQRQGAYWFACSGTTDDGLACFQGAERRDWKDAVQDWNAVMRDADQTESGNSLYDLLASVVHSHSTARRLLIRQRNDLSKHNLTLYGYQLVWDALTQEINELHNQIVTITTNNQKEN
jgi:hypothetical protein